MPHGDLSDYVGVSSLVFGLGSIFAPAAVAALSAGPIKPLVDGAASEATLAAMRLAGAAFVFVGTTSFGVRWNTVNHFSAAAGCAAISLVSAFNALSMDKYAFVPRPWWLLAAIHAVGAYHFYANPNPMLTSADLKKKEDAAAAKGK